MTEHKYRRDIDALRAVAILAVLFYHAGYKAFRGGFVGVDVFFVISGFLITKYIDDRNCNARFSLAEFYEKRIRRIAPALFAVLLACTVAAFLISLPVELRKYCASLMAVAGFSSNIFFWRETGYFDTSALFKPLLHTWSLSVEEQFYILFPIGFVFISRWTTRIRVAIVSFFMLASFAFAAWGSYAHPDATFFLLPSRAWELLLGSLLAIEVLRPTRSPWITNAMAAAGMTAICFSVFSYTDLPDLKVACACIGTGMIIYANAEVPTLLGRVMSIRPMVGVGLISYSLYLWHWPIFVFARQALTRPLSGVERALAVLISICLAALSWKFVEQPFRKSNGVFQRRALFMSSGVITSAFLILGLAGFAGRGFPGRFPAQVDRYDQGRLDSDPSTAQCDLSGRELNPKACVYGPGKDTRPPQFIVWGDSHALVLMPAFKAIAKERSMTAQYAVFSACPPFIGITPWIPEAEPSCTAFNNAILDSVEQQNISTVILVGSWGTYLFGLTPILQSDETQPEFFITDAETHEKSQAENKRVFERGLRRTLGRLQRPGRKIYLVLDVPHLNYSVPDYLAKGAKAGTIGPEAWVQCPQFSGPQEYVRSVIKSVAADYPVAVVEPASLWFNGSQCLIAREGHALYLDNNHVTTFGALQLSRTLLPMFDQIEAIKQP